jgi:DNA-binding transcriptional regulator YiaG
MIYIGTQYNIQIPSEWRAEDIRKLRNKLHISQKELAEILGVNVRSISGWENGHFIPGIPVCRMLDMLNHNTKEMLRLITDSLA